MRIASGKVVAGRVELDGELPEGASVTVLALEGDETFEADAETEKMLLESMAQCDDGRTTPFATRGRPPSCHHSHVVPPTAVLPERGRRSLVL